MHVSVFVYVYIMVYVSACNRDGAKGGLKAKLRIIKTKKWSWLKVKKNKQSNKKKQRCF